MLHNSINKFIPLTRKGKKKRMPKQIKNLLKLKRTIYKQSKSNPSYKTLYKNIDKQYRTAVKNHTSLLEQKVMNSNNKKAFFGYVNRKLHQRNNLPPLVNSNSDVLTGAKNKADLLNHQFVSVFSTDDNTKPPIFSQNFLNTFSQMDNFIITPTDVHQAISKLKNTVSRTPDEIPALYVKKVSNVLSKPLARIFNISIRTGKVPSIWKKAIDR